MARNGYQHTQPGTLIRVALGLSVLIAGVAAAILPAFSKEAGLALILVSALMAIALLLFHSLTVRVDQNEVVLWFGVGAIRKSYLVIDIESVDQVRNRFYYGWGIRKIPGGWLFNVSGFDAVELTMKNGRKRRIGTDQPKALLAAIAMVIDR